MWEISYEFLIKYSKYFHDTFTIGKCDPNGNKCFKSKLYVPTIFSPLRIACWIELFISLFDLLIKANEVILNNVIFNTFEEW